MVETVMTLVNWQQLVTSCDFISEKGLHFKDVVISKELHKVLTSDVKVVIAEPTLTKKVVKIYTLKEEVKNMKFKSYLYFIYLYLSEYDVVKSTDEETTDIDGELTALPMIDSLKFVDMLLNEHEV